VRQGHIYHPSSLAPDRDALAERADPPAQPTIRLVLNLCDLDRPRPVHRRGQGTFVATIVAGADNEREIMKASYPILVRSLSNMVIYNTRVHGVLESHFITIEQGHYIVRHTGSEQDFFARIFERIQPLACSHLVINNEFSPDLPAALAQGDQQTGQISWAGQQLDRLGLLPAAFPIHDLLSERDLKHVKRLYGIGGLSYGNLSARAQHDPGSFWMSASGVDKSQLHTIGRDILLVTGYVPERLMMRLSVPPGVEPRRVSVDAIEHFLIYREHPGVGAIVHIHAWWRDPIASTEVNYPCGTYELAAEVAELVRQAPDPTRAVIGLKNHGLTITGHSIPEIFDRIDGMIVPHVPMS
jgi:ribulose-5-phosphate 4-epimerase/fuculose-1-phosphate aldolase